MPAWTATISLRLSGEPFRSDHALAAVSANRRPRLAHAACRGRRLRPASALHNTYTRATHPIIHLSTRISDRCSYCRLSPLAGPPQPAAVMAEVVMANLCQEVYIRHWLCWQAA
jgi:hypothetical protein